MERTERIGGIIAAAKKEIWDGESLYMRPVGSITAIKRIVITYMKAGICPIVIVTGYEAEKLEYELSMYSVIFLNMEDYERKDLLCAAQIGIRYLKGKCNRVLFTPVNFPLVSPGTISEIMKIDASAVAPSYQGKGGHPILLSEEVFDGILSYRGEGGVPGFLENVGVSITYHDVKDSGIVSNLNEEHQDESLIETHNDLLYRPFLRIRLGKEDTFMGGRVKLLLSLIDETHSVRDACSYIRVSYSKAWTMLNKLEEGLGYQVVTRSHGGKHGGKTVLTPEGKKFLQDYAEFESRVQQYAMEEFYNIFGDLPTSN